ncbi:PKD domain-containing protein, partial [Kaarinaea lacus]
MGKTVPQYSQFILRSLLAVAIVLLTACGGGSSEVPPGGAPIVDDPSGDSSGGNNNVEPPPIEFPPEQLVINLGPDLILDDYGDEVLLSAGRTTATRLLWEQIGNGPRVRNLTNTDRFQVRFSPAIFSADTPGDARKTTLRLTGWDDQGNMASDEITVTFLPNNQTTPVNNTPPTIQEIPDVIVQPGETVELTAIASDAEDGIPQIRWREISTPALVLGSGESTGSILSFTAPSTPGTILFEVTATDSAGASASTNVSVEVMMNNSPTVSVGGDIQVESAQLVTVQGNASDRDGNIVSYLWEQVDGVPSLTLLDASTPSVSFTAPVVSIDTSFTIQLTVTDNLGATASDQLVVTVSPALANKPPTASAGINRTVNLGELITITGSGSDSDGSIVNFSWTQTDGPVVTLTGANSEVVSFTMPSDMQGQVAIVLQLTVTDDQGAIGIDQVEIRANAPPIANAGADQFLQPGDTVNLSSIGSDDPDGNIISYLWTQVGGATTVIFNRNSANPGFQAPQLPANLDSDNLTFELTVTDDNGAIGKDTVVIHITRNVPPTANAGPDLTVNSGDATPVTITGSGFDNDGNIINLFWTQVAGPPVTLNGANTATVSFDVPEVQQQSIITLRLTVVDDGGADGSDAVSITINAPLPNNAPVANAGVDQRVAGGDLVTLSGLGSDQDLDPLTYSWRQTNGPSITLNNANSPTANFTAPQVTTTTNITIELTVTDDKGASGTDFVNISVEPVTNASPTVDVGTDFAVLSGNNVTITGNAVDSDGQIVQYTWAKIAGPAVVLNGTATATVDFIAPDVTQSTQLHLRLTVVDDQGASASDDVFITINPVNAGNGVPVVNVGGDFTAVSGENVSITGSATDDGVITTYIWTQMS